MCKISVICPVYNAENVLSKAIQCILKQSFHEWELLLIDDGSEDNSGILCDEYARKDSRIKVVHKINEGVSSARQAGVEEANGEYIIHIDSDDWVEDNMLESMYTAIKSVDADILICDYYLNTEGKQIYCPQMPTNVKDNFAIIRDMASFLFGATWNKLVKLEVIKKYNVRFIENINFCEDTLFFYQLLKCPVKCSYLNAAFYHYVKSTNTITTSINSKVIKNRINSYGVLTAILCGNEYKCNHQSYLMDILNDTLKANTIDNEIFDKLRNLCDTRFLLTHTSRLKMRLVYLFFKLRLYKIALTLY